MSFSLNSLLFTNAAIYGASAAWGIASPDCARAVMMDKDAIGCSTGISVANLFLREGSYLALGAAVIAVSMTGVSDKKEEHAFASKRAVLTGLGLHLVLSGVSSIFNANKDTAYNTNVFYVNGAVCLLLGAVNIYAAQIRASSQEED